MNQRQSKRRDSVVSLVHWCIEGSDLGSNIHIRKVDAPPWLKDFMLHARQFCGNHHHTHHHTSAQKGDKQKILMFALMHCYTYHVVVSRTDSKVLVKLQK